ncbi:hypothetical protein [Actinomadura rudentiformis]|uniref:Uncharacterized protein n=1 Tax=Actinomadura rudentiformis TaxID=359158 RepID=A0A6H9YV36_9ACTN|nr:hypothetical protein [Actinomadura rudentiformis]KAB2346070.1 hypothetical protein F8566_25540 [Actinomadura rudentiformis]
MLVAVAASASVAVASSLTWTFSPGGQIVATNVGNIVPRNLTRGSLISCSEAEVKATAKTGSGLSGIGLVSVDEVRLGGYTGDPEICEGPSNLAMQIVINDLPLEFNADSYDASTGTTRGKLVNDDAGGVTAKVIGLDDGCEADWTGSAGTPGNIDISYSNRTGEVTIEGTNLEAVNVNANCPAAFIRNGDKLGVTGIFKANPVQTVTAQ